MEAHDEQIGQGHGPIGRLEQGDAEETDQLQGPSGVLQRPKPGGAATVHAAGIGPLPFQAERRSRISIDVERFEEVDFVELLLEPLEFAPGCLL